jgi:hypothetical protein
MGAPGQVREGDVHGLVFGFRRGECFWQMFDQEHEDVPEDQRDTNVGMRTRAFVVAWLGMPMGRFIVLWSVHTRMSFFMTFCRIVVATLLRVCFLNWLLGLAVLAFLELPVDGIFVAGNFGDRRLGCIWMGIHAICSLPRGELVREWYTLL